MKTALVAGSTGLVGSTLMQLLLSSDRYGKVIALVRSRPVSEHPKLNVIEADFGDLDEVAGNIAADDVFCCLGTTMAKAKTKENFRRVDYEYVVRLASLASQSGARQFLLVSALGADKESSIFYNRVKGETELAVTKLPFECIHVFRPSLLLGSRGEKRPGEDVAKVLYRIFGSLIPSKYKAIEAEVVARAMGRAAARDEKGIFFHESREMQQEFNR